MPVPNLSRDLTDKRLPPQRRQVSVRGAVASRVQGRLNTGVLDYLRPVQRGRARAVQPSRTD